MVEHRPQGVLAVRGRGGQFHSLGYGCSQRSRVLRVTRDNVLAGTSRHRGRPCHSSAEGTHNGRAVGLLLHRDFYLIDCRFQSEDRSGIGQGCAPLPRTGLGSDVGRSFLFGIVALGQGRVDLV